jgi:hypothetical protein
MPATPRTAATTPAEPTTPVSAPKPITLPSSIPAPKPAPSTIVAGESASKIAVLKETPTFSMAQNTDQSLEPGNPVPAPEPTVSWVKRLMLNSDKISGLVLETIFILVIIATTGMVAREYEKHHRRHMAYGTLLAVIMFSSLFVGKLGFFTPSQPLAAAPAAASALDAVR